MIRVILILITFSYSNFIPTIQTQFGENSNLILSNYINNYEDCQINSISDNLNLQIQNDVLVVHQKNTVSGIEIIEIECEGNEYQIPVRKRFSKDVEFNYFSDNENLNVFVMGNFNDWSRNSHPLDYINGAYNLSKNFTPGNYEYKFVVDGNEILDNNNLDSIPNGLGGWNNTFQVHKENVNNPGQIIKSEIFYDSTQIVLEFDLHRTDRAVRSARPRGFERGSTFVEAKFEAPRLCGCRQEGQGSWGSILNGVKISLLFSL